MRFLHAADLHLDSPLRGLDRYPGAPVDAVREATRRALDGLVDLAIREAAAFVVLAGDVWDGEWRDYKTGLFFADRMARLGRHGIRVFLVRGNHDAGNRALKRLALPDTVHEFGTRRPGTVRLDDLGVALHGQGYDREAVDEDLAAGYPDAVPGLLNVGVLHTSLDGRPGHDAYAPTTADRLAAKGYDYWALGHVHAREVVRRDPWIVFPGNLQGRHARETGEKGCTVVTVEDGRVVSAEPRTLCVLRWAVRDVDASGAATAEEVVARVRGAVEDEVRASAVRTVAVRVRLLGACPAHRALVENPSRWLAELRAAALDGGQGDAWIEKVELRTRVPLDLDRAGQRDDAVGELLRSIRARGEDDDALKALGAELEALQKKLPAELASGPDPVRLDDPAFLRAMLEAARDLLAARLLGGEVEP